jgi:hypothetical protein
MDVHLGPLVEGHARERCILEDPTFYETHDVERSADNPSIFTQNVGLGGGNIARFKGVNDTVFSLDLVGGLGEQLARRFLAQHKSSTIRGRKQVCWIGLPIRKLVLVRGKT